MKLMNEHGNRHGIRESYLSCPAVSHISNLTVVESCKAIVCDKNEAPTVT